MNHFTIPTSAYASEILIAEAGLLGIDPTDENLRRVEKGIALHKHGMVHQSPQSELFYVRSQVEYYRMYVVLPYSGCHCMDAKRLNAEFGRADSYNAGWDRIQNSTQRCKHEIAVALYKTEKEDTMLGGLNALSDDVFETINPDDYPDGEFPY